MFHLMELKYSNIVLTIKVTYGFKSTAKGFYTEHEVKTDSSFYIHVGECYKKVYL